MDTESTVLRDSEGHNNRHNSITEQNEHQLYGLKQEWQQAKLNNNPTFRYLTLSKRVYVCDVVVGEETQSKVNDCIDRVAASMHYTWLVFYNVLNVRVYVFTQKLPLALASLFIF